MSWQGCGLPPHLITPNIPNHMIHNHDGMIRVMVVLDRAQALAPPQLQLQRTHQPRRLMHRKGELLITKIGANPPNTLPFLYPLLMPLFHIPPHILLSPHLHLLPYLRLPIPMNPFSSHASPASRLNYFNPFHLQILLLLQWHHLSDTV